MNPPKLSKPARLSLRYIETKPKVVGFVGDDPDIKVALSPRQQDDLEFLIDCIEAGGPIPARFYRPSMGRRGDDMLVKGKVMHLHLDGPSDALVYLIQYENAVLLIEVNTHIHLSDRPEGKKLCIDLINKAERELHKNPPPKPAVIPAEGAAAGTSVSPADRATSGPLPEETE